MRSGATGLRAWVYQRISAIYLAVFSLFLIGHFLLNPPGDVEAWRAWVARPGVAVGGHLFFLALAVHAWVGIRDVLIDYVHPAAIRLTLLLLFGFVLIASAAWAMQVILLAAR
jgi:succinate dehydrogenase / fumarate reductase membrane anchor subunit